MTSRHKYSLATLLLIFVFTLHFLAPVTATAKFECIGTYGGRIDSFLVYQHYLYLAKGYNLQVLDIADPAQPKEVGWLRISGLIQSMDISEHTLYLGTFNFKGGADLDEDGVKILDLSNPVRPVMHGTIKEASRSVSLKVLGSYLLVNWGGKYSTSYTVYGIKDPFRPQELESGSFKFSWDCFITDGKNLIVTQKHHQEQIDNGYKLAFIDKLTSRTLAMRTFTYENPPSIRQLAEIPGINESVKLTNNSDGEAAWLYSQGLTSIETHGGWTLQKKMWSFHDDYSDGVQVLKSGRVMLQLNADNWDSNKATLAGSVLYAIVNKGHLKCYDLSDPAQIRERDVFPKTIEDCRGILVTGHLALINDKAGLTIFDITKPLEPIPVGSRIPSVMVHGFKIADHKAYLNDDEGLTILDLAQPDHPKVLGQLRNPKLSRVRAVEDNLVFVDGGKEEPSELFVVDCSNPTSPTLVGNWHGPLGPMSSSATRLTIAAGKAGLLILDTSNPTAIKQIGTYPTKEPCTDLVTSGTLVYLLAKDLQVVDTSNPANLKMLGQLKINEKDEENWGQLFLKKRGNTLFLIRDAGMWSECQFNAIDVSDPKMPMMSYPTDPPDPRRTNQFKGWYLTLPAYDHNTGGTWYGMDIHDVSNPTQADTKVEQYEALQTEVPPALFKNFICFADGTGCLVILQEKGTPASR